MLAEGLETRTLLTTLAWSAGPSLPAPRTDAVAVVTSDNAVRVLGGDSAAATAAPVLAANATNWSVGVNIDTQRRDLGAVSTGSSVYLFGGTGKNEGSDEVLTYDYRFGDSQDLAKMNTIRYDLGYAADASGRVYALGGIGVFADGEIWADAERYDPASDTWTSIAPLPQALHGLSAIGDGDGHVFAFGGSTTLDDSGVQRLSYRYDITTDTWSTVAPLPIGTRDSAVTADDDGSIYVIGGMTSTGATDAVQQYDPATNAWIAQTSLPAPVHSHAATFGPGGKIIVAGGFDANGNPTDAVYQTQNLTVPDVAPVISTTPVTNGSLDSFYSYDVDATGNPDPEYSLVTSPAGMTIDATGVISWQPLAGQLGSHSVVVQASNRAGSVDQSFDITVVADTIAPTTPADFAVDSVTETSVTLNWTAATDAVGVDHYDVATAAYVGPRFGKRWVYTVVDSVTTTTSTVSGFAPLTTEDFAVRAVDAAGNASPWSPRIFATTLSAPDLKFSYGTQTTGAVESPAKTPLEIQLSSRANPAATFSLITGPATMMVNPTSGSVQWTPDVADIGVHDVTFRATNLVGSADLTISINVRSDAPQLGVQFTSGGYALAGTLFTAQILDSSNSPPTYSLLAAPTGLTLDAITGAIEWTPLGVQGGGQTVTVRGVNEGGTTDLTFSINTLFTSAVTGVNVTGTSLLEPTAHWVAPTGEGSDRVGSYQIHGFAEWGVGRTHTTHTVDYTVPVSETSVLMTGLVTGKSYRLTITPLDSAGNRGLANNEATFVSSPALPQVSWSVNGFTGGLSVPGPVIAEQPVEIVLTDGRPDPSTMTLVSGPEGLTFDSLTHTGSWTPTAAQVTSGYTTTTATFQATNSVGSVDVIVPMRVFFSDTVHNAVATKFGDNGTASWDAPTNNVTPITAYSITRYWHWQSHRYSSTWTVAPTVTSIAFALIPTGTAVHDGISIAPVDEFGNFGVSTQRIAFGSYQNDLPPFAVDDAYDATEDTALVVNSLDGVRVNDIDTDNTPYLNPLTVQLVSGPANGTLSLGSSGLFTYTPNADFHGTDTFVYRDYDGRYYSNNATVTINVVAVNDRPAALDDYYSVDHNATLVIDPAGGVLTNDSDVDGDALATTVVANPANGTVSLSIDGSFTYMPNAGFSGIDTFTYVASDSLLDSRIASVNIDVVAPTTKFFVVDTDVEGTFAYADDGTLVDNYSLRTGNAGSQGVASSSDGSTVYVLNGNKRVFVYDGDGGYLGRWLAIDPTRVGGIATDDTDIWILDRKLDAVLHYAGAASLTSGEMEATDSFSLHANNKNGKGMTTDGTHIWVVNDIGGLDKVYKYTVDGMYVGRWNIDPANVQPTGITIDPTGASDAIWIVDKGTDSVYQYNGGSARISGSDLADATFALASTNTNPQGIADPPPTASQFTRTMAASTDPFMSAVPDRVNRADVGSRGGARPVLSNGRHDVFSDFGRSDRNEDLVADLARAIVATKPRPDRRVVKRATADRLRERLGEQRSDQVTRELLADENLIDSLFLSCDESVDKLAVL